MKHADGAGACILGLALRANGIFKKDLLMVLKYMSTNLFSGCN